MDVTPLVKQGQNIVQSYGNGSLKISGQVFDSPVIIRPEQVESWDIPDGFSSLSEHHFKIFSNDDVILLGCGERMQLLPLALRNALRLNGVNVDVMDTGAACRTYNMLMSEGRNVAAAVIPF